MTSFDINSFDNIEFTVPAGKDKSITLVVPPMDCMAPAEVEKLNKFLEDINEDDSIRDELKPGKDQTGAALVRSMLKFFNQTKAKTEAIDNLVPRQLTAIDRHWAEESGIDMGESEGSSESSSETE